MKIAILGAGYVGLVSGAGFSEFGHQVTLVDTDAAKIAALQAGRIPIYEPELEDLVARNAPSRLNFTTNLDEALAGAEAIFIAVGTPTRQEGGTAEGRRGEGHADLQYVFAAAEEIAKRLTQYAVIVTKSTVPVGTGREVAARMRAANPAAEFDVASNPEFLREGSAVGDFLRPDRVIIGTESARAQELLRALYRPLYLLETPVLITNLETAELTKYAANAFLAAKITFINEMADLCERVGADVQDVARGMGLDGRIGKKFLHAGPGYGGSCFPKDTLALVRTAQDAGTPLKIVEAVVAANVRRKAQMAQRIVAACGGDVRAKKIAVLGVTFKPNTDDMREAPSLTILHALQQAGARIAAFDPAGMRAAAELLPDIEWTEDAYATMPGASALVILTEWNVFRALDLSRMKTLLQVPTVVDLRNIYNPQEMRALGFTYHSIGRS